MRSRRIVAGLSLLLLGVCVFLSVSAFLSRHTVCASPETESAFLKSYHPDAAVEAFESKHGVTGWLGGISASAGEGFASHHREFHGEFEIEAKGWTPLMTALTNDVADQLARNGAKLLGEGGGPDTGFHFRYQDGKILGVVIVAPLRNRADKSAVLRGVPVAVDIYLDETWFPNLLNKPSGL